MGWPQIVVLVVMVLCLIRDSVQWIRDPALSSTQVTLTILLGAAIQGGYAWVLRAGGFW